MKNQLYIILSMLLAVSCTNQGQKSEDKTSQKTEIPKIEEDPTLISCEGIGKVKFSMSYSDLEQTFGKDKIKSDTLLTNTSITGDGKIGYSINTVIDAPEGKIRVVWEEGKKAKSIEQLSIDYGTKSLYKFASGVGIGAKPEEIFKANNNVDFEFYGLGWDFGGTIVHEKAEGDFFKNSPCFRGYFGTKDGSYTKTMNLLGDRKFKASKVSKKEADELLLKNITLVRKSNTPNGMAKVLAESGCSIREFPTVNSEKIGYATQGDLLKIIEKTKVSEAIENKSGYWYKVSYEGKTGYCFGGFLEVNF